MFRGGEKAEIKIVKIKNSKQNEYNVQNYTKLDNKLFCIIISYIIILRLESETMGECLRQFCLE